MNQTIGNYMVTKMINAYQKESFSTPQELKEKAEKQIEKRYEIYAEMGKHNPCGGSYTGKDYNEALQKFLSDPMIQHNLSKNYESITIEIEKG
jgi:hypothetical protein